MSIADRRLRLRALLNGKRCVTAASVFDPLSARIAEDLGYDVGILAGSVASLVVTGAPDLMGLTAGELAEQARRIGQAADLGLLVDADDGYGNALNVGRTVASLESAGIAALTLEDTLLPLPYGRPVPDRLVPLEEGVGKLRAALAARADSGMLVVGRTSALELTTLDDAVQRLAAYAVAGADAIFPVGVTELSQLQAIREAIALPMILYVDRPALSDVGALASLGVRIAVQPHTPIWAAMQAVHDTMKALRDGVSPDALTGLPDVDFQRRVTRQAHYERYLATYLR